MTADMNITKFVSNKIPVEFDFLQGGTLTGNKKLAQSWIKLFLTDRGSQEYYPTIGSSFLDALRTGNIRNNNSVTSNFNIAAEEIAATLRNDDATNALPNTEQLSEAILDNFVIESSKSLLVLFITLIPVEGDPITFDVPVSTKG